MKTIGTPLDLLESEALSAAMAEAIEAARTAQFPFGAVLVDTTDGTIVARSANGAEHGDPTAHAELRLLQTVGRISTPAARCVLVTTAEPCPMCAGAAVWAGVAAICYGTSIRTLVKAGWPQLDLPAHELTSRMVPASNLLTVVGGICERECDALYADSAPYLERARRLSHARDPRPVNHHFLTPYLAVPSVPEAIAFYQKAFDATAHLVVPAGDDVVYHAEIVVNGTVVSLHEDLPGTARARPPTLASTTTVTLTLWVGDVDAAFAKAVAAGARVDSPPQDTYWGDRMARVTDTAGHGWTLASHVRDVPTEEQCQGARAHRATLTPHPAAGWQAVPAQSTAMT